MVTAIKTIRERRRDVGITILRLKIIQISLVTE
jgi:hypothetical protein